MNKTCTTCAQELPEDEFYLRNKETGRRATKCRNCLKASRAKRKFDPKSEYNTASLKKKALKWKTKGDPRWQLYDHDWFFDRYGKKELQDIGAEVSASKSEMTRVTKFHGVSKSFGSKRKLNKTAFKSAHANGGSYSDLALEFGLSERTVNRIVVEEEMRRARSGGEIQLAEYVRSITTEKIITGDRKTIFPLELDIYIPDKNVAIEFNGLYWHSSKQKDKYYHRDKWKACEDKGIQLIQIWEDEWRDKREIVETMIVHKLGVSNSSKVYARMCEAKLVLPSEADEFHSQHHLQGARSNCYHLGLYCDEKLLAVYSFTQNNDVHELVRYSTSCIVVGGFSKLQAAHIRNYEPKLIKTFADLCVSQGSLYESNGWTKTSTLPPTFSVLENNYTTRRHRLAYQKSFFRKNQPNYKYEDSMSTMELIELNDLPLIYDAGKIRYIYEASL